jgi:hypothetical protein
LSAADTEKLAAVTTELVALYPQLAEYVGKDGVLMLEKGRVEALCASYRELQLQKLATARVEQLRGTHADALLELTRLQVLQEDEGKNNDTLVAQANKILEARNAMQAVYQAGVDNELFIAESGKALDAFVDAGGDLMAVMKQLEKYEPNIYGLFEKGELRADLTEDELWMVSDLLEYADTQAQTEYNALWEQIRDSTARYEQLSAEIAKAEALANEINEDVEINERALKRMIEGGANVGADTGESIADGLSDQAASVADAIANIAKTAQIEAAKHPIVFRTQIEGMVIGESGIDGSHATGLSYVPYDGYLARLHVGERVLTAAEAREYGKSGGAGIDYDALAAAVHRANVGTNAQPIQLVIDGRVMAQTLAEQNRTAIGGREKRIGAGVGR